MLNTVNQPISESRLMECEISARFWAAEIGKYAQRMRKRADSFALLSALLSTLTGLGVWTTLASSTHWLAVLAVSVVALAAATSSLIPQIYGYGKCADAASALGPRYGNVLGDLMDALAMLKKDDPNAQSFAIQTVKEFEDIKAEKDALKPFPLDLQVKKDKILEQKK
jgi:hypothetical protein